jgi:hypothetical protein
MRFARGKPGRLLTAMIEEFFPDNPHRGQVIASKAFDTKRSRIEYAELAMVDWARRETGVDEWER